MNEGNGHGNGKVSPACLPAVREPSSASVPVVPSLPAVVSSAEGLKPSAYVPPTRAISLLHAYMSLAGQGARVTNAMLAQAMIPPMTEPALQKWRTRHPADEAWVMAELQRRTEGEWPLILRRACELAIKGSIDHMRFFAEVTGRAKVAGSASLAVVGGDHARIQVNVHGLPVEP